MCNDTVYIWGADDYNTLGLCRQIGAGGYRVCFVSWGGLYKCTGKSRYCTRHVSTASIGEGYEFLMKNHPASRAVLINTNDLIAGFIDEHRADFEKFYYVSGTDCPGRLEEYNDKYRMSSLAGKLGFRIPATLRIVPGDKLPDQGYPYILKPSGKTPGHINPFKTRICKSRRELERVLKLVRKDSEFVLQEVIPQESVALVYGCRLMDDTVLIAGVLDKERFNDRGDGSYGFISPILPEAISAKDIENLVRTINYYGLFSVEYGIVGDKAYFYEINLRNDGTSHLFFQAGANLPLIWTKSLLGEDCAGIPAKVVRGAVFMDELFDSVNIGRKGLTSRQWRAQKEAVSLFKYYDKDDMEPYRFVKKRSGYLKFLDHIASKYRLFIVYLFDKLGIGSL